MTEGPQELKPKPRDAWEGPIPDETVLWREPSSRTKDAIVIRGVPQAGLPGEQNLGPVCRWGLEVLRSVPVEGRGMTQDWEEGELGPQRSPTAALDWNFKLAQVGPRWPASYTPTWINHQMWVTLRRGETLGKATFFSCRNPWKGWPLKAV